MNTNVSPGAASVYIGRFQPFHGGHAALLRRALAAAELCVVVIGSAFQARSPKNPFTWQERAEMIRLAAAEVDRERLLFLPVRDYYDGDRWTAAVRRGVADALAGRSIAAQNIALFGHFKDASSDYLNGFADWQLHGLERQSAANATAIRNAYFAGAGGDIEAALAALVEQAPPATLAFLRAWAELPHYAALAQEWRCLRDYRASWAAAPYPPVFVTVDAVVHCAGRVLLVRRGQAPGKGLYALPGGFIEQNETVYESALRELREETALGLLEMSLRQCLKQVRVFDHPERSQRGRTITHAHYFDLGSRELPEVHAGDDAAGAEWLPVAQLPALEAGFLDDHFHILDYFFGLTRGEG
ncbi:MAG: bifunctional nicotinamide-nucleotide adenylyltransferase/Nudix hydroxylase [Rhodocyclaceae bacterium]|nr:bifunctional nicotinamide-nucleotide adenylyltransferase/Nudix hydroxylase [Rhodocyclaceae bacterium]